MCPCGAIEYVDRATAETLPDEAAKAAEQRVLDCIKPPKNKPDA